MTIPFNRYRALCTLAVSLLPLVLVVACSAAGERVPPQSASETKKEAAKAAAPAPAAGSVAKAPAAAAAAKESGAGKAGAATPSKPKLSSIYLGSDGKMAGTGDPNRPVSDAYKIGMSARPAALAGAGLPKDKFGLIDWVAVVKDGDIKPRGSLDPNKPDIPPFDMNVLIETKGDFVNNVLFPHSTHTYWLGCDNCHPAIFVMGKGKNKMSMMEISEGKWCGRCHGKVAFPLTDCSRCHTQKKKS